MLPYTNIYVYIYDGTQEHIECNPLVTLQEPHRDGRRSLLQNMHRRRHARCIRPAGGGISV